MNPKFSIPALTCLAMLAFAGNSVLARLALAGADSSPWSFTLVRLVSGALVLAVLASPRRAVSSGSWRSAAALLTYAGLFSLAYLWLDAGTGALILFACVQITMIGVGVVMGERLRMLQWLGMALALAGLIYLLQPSTTAPAPFGALAMAISGSGWGIYSLRGRCKSDPVSTSAGNFLRAATLAAALTLPILLLLPEPMPGLRTLTIAALSGAITSGLGYVIWYRALKGLSAAQAGIAQLSVPAIAALGGILFLAEPLSLRFIMASAIILAGVAIATLTRSRT